jgi:hypothetical protein
MTVGRARTGKEGEAKEQEDDPQRLFAQFRYSYHIIENILCFYHFVFNLHKVVQKN